MGIGRLKEIIQRGNGIYARLAEEDTRMLKTRRRRMERWNANASDKVLLASGGVPKKDWGRGCP